jgi:hypothetical protein
MANLGCFPGNDDVCWERQTKQAALEPLLMLIAKGVPFIPAQKKNGQGQLAFVDGAWYHH